jgi:tritrans,polycis-undecaprenyl-diphosphate synthase [geranylgeranyl-diphosphate specific]
MLRSLLSALGVYKLYERWLRMQIEGGRMPAHIGVILDGNRRWARSHNLIAVQGHWEGADRVKKLLEWCFNFNIKAVTLYAFSTENFSRSTEEVGELMKIYETYLDELLKSNVVHENQVKIRVLGRTTMLPEKLQGLITKTEKATENYDRFFLNVALAYGGRAEIIDATRAIAEEIKAGSLEPAEINEQVMEKHLYTSYMPNPEPDLIIRTSGEFRLSNFLLWQAAYSEIFIVDVYWPEFREIDLERAIRSYQQRGRRLGK